VHPIDLPASKHARKFREVGPHDAHHADLRPAAQSCGLLESGVGVEGQAHGCVNLSRGTWIGWSRPKQSRAGGVETELRKARRRVRAARAVRWPHATDTTTGHLEEVRDHLVIPQQAQPNGARRRRGAREDGGEAGVASAIRRG
jgi:hypothetical protein